MGEAEEEEGVTWREEEEDPKPEEEEEAEEVDGGCGCTAPSPPCGGTIATGATFYRERERTELDKRKQVFPVDRISF